MKHWLVIGALLSAIGCRAPSKPPIEGRALALPTKDELALVDGQPISIAGFSTIKSSLSKPSNEAALWIATAALAAQHDTKRQGRDLTLTVAVKMARYALADLPFQGAEASLRVYYGAKGSLPSSLQVKQDLEQLMLRSVIQENRALLMALD